MHKNKCHFCILCTKKQPFFKVLIRFQAQNRPKMPKISYTCTNGILHFLTVFLPFNYIQIYKITHFFVIFKIFSKNFKKFCFFIKIRKNRAFLPKKEQPALKNPNALLHQSVHCFYKNSLLSSPLLSTSEAFIVARIISDNTQSNKRELSLMPIHSCQECLN